MANSKIIIAGVLLTTIFGLTACGGDDNSVNTESEVVLNIPDPVQPVLADVTIGGGFASESGNLPEDLEPEKISIIIYRDGESNSLSRAEIDQAGDFSLDSFASAFDAVKARRPNSSTSSNEFARAIIAELTKTSKKASKKTALSAQGFLDSLFDLTPAERELVLKNPYKAYKSKVAAEDAVAATDALFTGSKYLTRADAFRHSYWN